MNAIFKKHQRIRARGQATLRIDKNNPLSRYNGNTFPVLDIGKPGNKCPVTLLIKEMPVRVYLEDLL